jgi:hypothetical protein
MAYGTLADGMISGSAGIFNGESSGEGQNSSGVDTKHTGVFALRVNPTGSMNVAEEGDIDWTEELATSVGVVYAHSDREVNGLASVQDNTNLINVDANLKYMGLGINAEYFTTNTDVAGDASGFYVQGGYFFVPKKLEIAARYGRTDCDNGNAISANPTSGTAVSCAGMDNISEASASLNYYFWRHNLKAQLGYDHVSYDSTGTASDVKSNRYIFQLSSYF